MTFGPKPNDMAQVGTRDAAVEADTSDARPTRFAIGRRSLLAGLSSAALLSASQSGLAQGSKNWWDELISGGTKVASQTPSAEPKKPEQLNDLRPDATPYRSDAMIEAIDVAIQKYERLASNGSWPTIPGTRAIRPEDDDERVPLLRRRLAASGDLKPEHARTSSFSFDGELELAVRRFQEAHGMRVSGRVDRPTLQAMNVSLQSRIAQLRLNQQRLRDLLATRPEDRYILVNAAAFQLEAVDRGEVQQRHRIIGGRVERQTPIVKASIKALNFFPFWRVPDSVATLDLIPKLRKEPEYLAKEKIRVLAGEFNGRELDVSSVDWNTATSTQIKFRQDPGPQNALGLVRIDMPNSEGVYMHDTPMKHLFTQRGRSFSAGCVRVQDVFKLADWIARYEMGWDRPGRSQEVVDAGQALDLTLTRQVPVYFTYITAWAEPNGSVQFRPDIYGRDGIKDSTAGRDRDESEGPAPVAALAP
jgi:L,D-transpeptidase YcbB